MRARTTRTTGRELHKEDLTLGGIEYRLYISSREAALGNLGRN